MPVPGRSTRGIYGCFRQMWVVGSDGYRDERVFSRQADTAGRVRAQKRLHGDESLSKGWRGRWRTATVKEGA